MQTPEPTGAITPAALSEMLADQQKAFDALRIADRRRAQVDKRNAVDQAKLDTVQMMQGRAQESYERGCFALSVLTNDPYRDTRAVLAEIRTDRLALRLSVDAVEYTYDVDGYVQGRYTRRRISRHFDTVTEAKDFFAYASARLFSVSDFRTQVDF